MNEDHMQRAMHRLLGVVKMEMLFSSVKILISRIIVQDRHRQHSCLVVPAALI